MAAPKGNQYALGCETSGRPRLEDYAEHAENLLKWAEKPSSINLTGFYIEYGLDPDLFYQRTKRDEELARAYKLCKMRIAQRREEYHNFGRLTPTAYGRNLRNYDIPLDQHEREVYEFQKSVDRETEKTTPVSDKIQVIDYKKAHDDLKKGYDD